MTDVASPAAADPGGAARVKRAVRRIRRCAGLIVLLALSAAQAAPPHLDLDIALDPYTGALRAKAALTTSAGAPDLALAPQFKVSRLTLNGRAVAHAADLARALKRQQSGAPRRIGLEYSGTLPPLPDPRRNSPNPGGLYASAAGTYLSPGARWYPDPGVPFTFRLRLSLPPGQKGLAPGRQLRQSDSSAGYAAEYEFPATAEGLWLIAGPYRVAQQSLALDDGAQVMVRTWFHPEIAELADGYLRDSAAYLQRYSRLIGAYPFGDFSIVSSPLSHGVGIPSLTYLGRDVLRLPFIRATSLGHEVLHNWWGNGVYPDWQHGNWSEGLTTFMADYAYREDQSDAAARDMRLNWLRDLAAVAPPDETSLVDFQSRQHGISSVIGYGKSAMVFFMLRDEIGQAAFERGLRLFWQRHRFGSAGWKELQAAFAEAGGRDLSAFFAQWTARASSPRLLLASAPGQQQRGVRLVQQGEVFALQVPLRIRMASGETREMKLRVHERETLLDPAAIPPGAKEIELDPELRLWRRLEPRAVPPIFRDTFIAPRAEVFLASQGAQWTDSAMALAGRLLDSGLRQVDAAQLLASPLPALVLGDRAGIARVLSDFGLGAVPEVLLQAGAGPSGDARPLKGSAQAWTARAGNGKVLAFVMAESPQALAALQRALPHYGRQSWLVFQEGRVTDQGAWPVAAQTLLLQGAMR
ncbi:MAG: hypothetical protein NDJ19_08235 [Ramlibacter sp.]|nr:hypothetical protein [Ramlibacter sp.]